MIYYGTITFDKSVNRTEINLFCNNETVVAWWVYFVLSVFTMNIHSTDSHLVSLGLKLVSSYKLGPEPLIGIEHIYKDIFRILIGWFSKILCIMLAYYQTYSNEMLNIHNKFY